MENPTKNETDIFSQFLLVKDKVDKIKSPDNLDALLAIENSNAARITLIENDIKAFKVYLASD